MKMNDGTFMVPQRRRGTRRSPASRQGDEAGGWNHMGAKALRQVERACARIGQRGFNEFGRAV